jgi:hypothetical protein
VRIRTVRNRESRARTSRRPASPTPHRIPRPTAPTTKPRTKSVHSRRNRRRPARLLPSQTAVRVRSASRGSPTMRRRPSRNGPPPHRPEAKLDRPSRPTRATDHRVANPRPLRRKRGSGGNSPPPRPPVPTP